MCLALVPILPKTSSPWRFRYGQTGLCIPLPPITEKSQAPGHGYSFGVVVVVVVVALNSALAAVVAVGQLAISRSARRSSSDSRSVQGSSSSSSDVELARRFLPVAAWDCVCVLPVAALGLLAAARAGVLPPSPSPVPGRVAGGVLLALSALPLLRSAARPLLYALGAALQRRRRARRRSRLQRRLKSMNKTFTRGEAVEQLKAWLKSGHFSSEELTPACTQSK